MPIHNIDVVEIFNNIADLLEIENANPFRIRAYRNAARNIQTMTQDLKTLIEKGEDLKNIHGIGKDLEEKIREIIDTGECKALLDLQKEVPASVSSLLKIPGLGPKRVQILYKELGINTPKQLEHAICKGQVRALHGFGKKLEEKVLYALKTHAEKKRPFILEIASQYAEPLAKYLRNSKNVDSVHIAGSYRRQKETVGDIDILVTASSRNSVIERFATYDEVVNIISKGNTRASVILRCGLQVDLRVVGKHNSGAALHYLTGSKAHNLAIRRLAQKHNMKINEYGVYKNNKRIAGITESSVYHSLGLPFIPPELREDHGEIEAAQQNKLPELIDISEIKGDLHMHTRASDGAYTIKQMAHRALQSKFQYIAITDHSKGLSVTHGLNSNALEKQIEEIDSLNEKLKEIHILKGIEVEILEDGSLDLPDSILGKLDLVIGAVHSKFNLTRAKQTQRVMRAINHRYFTILAHPSGRLLNERQPYDIDMNRIINEAKNRGCFLELNAQPNRLDLNDSHCQTAKNEGVLISINSDSHETVGFDNLKYGIGQARRGWLTAQDVVNTRAIKSLHKLLKSTMS